MVVMDEYDLMSDPCDNRIIRIYNCLVLLSCICDLAAIISGNDMLKTISDIIDIIVHIMFQCISGCMTAQTAYEGKYSIKEMIVYDIHYNHFYVFLVDFRANKQTGVTENLK